MKKKIAIFLVVVIGVYLSFQLVGKLTEESSLSYGLSTLLALIGGGVFAVIIRLAIWTFRLIVRLARRAIKESGILEGLLSKALGIQSSSAPVRKEESTNSKEGDPKEEYSAKKRETKMFKVIVFFLIVLAIIALGLLAGTIYFAMQHNLIVLATGIGLLIAVIILMKSVTILGPEEMGEFIFLGKMLGFRSNGPHLVIPFFSHIEKRPTTLFDVDYEEFVEIVTKEGFFPEDSTEEKDYYGSIIVKVDPVAYIALPQTDEGTDVDEIGNLSLTIKRGVPFIKDGLRDFTQESVESVLRAEGGKKTWGELKEDLADITGKANDLFRKESPLVMAGFGKEDIRLGIKRIIFPKELENALLDPEKQKFAKTAAITKAKGDAEVQLITSKAEAEAEFHKEVGAWLHVKARVAGVTIEEFDEMMKQDEELQVSVEEELTGYFEELHKDVELAKLHALFEFRSNRPGSTGGLLDIVPEVIALWHNLKGGGGAQQADVQKKDQEEKQTIKEKGSSSSAGSDALTEEEMDDMEDELEAELKAEEAEEAEDIE